MFLCASFYMMFVTAAVFYYDRLHFSLVRSLIASNECMPNDCIVYIYKCMCNHPVCMHFVTQTQAPDPKFTWMHYIYINFGFDVSFYCGSRFIEVNHNATKYIHRLNNGTSHIILKENVRSISTAKYWF